MKVMFYLNALGMGGAEKVVANLANQFVKHGDICTVVTSNYAEIERVLDNRVKRIAFFRNRLAINVVVRNVILARKLRKTIKEEKPDIVISFMREPNFRMLIASVGLPVKRLISVRNDPNHEYPTKISRLLAKMLYRFADGIVFQTKDARDWFPISIQRKSKIIFNQVDEVFFETNYEGDREGIIVTGSLEPRKNHILLIDAFGEIADKIDDNVYIYGKGSFEKKEKEYVKFKGLESRVFFMGPTVNVAETVKSARLYVLTSNYEGMPNALMEAMALGIPCIATDCPCGGPKALFGEELKDYLVPTNDCKRLSDLMLSLLSNQKILDEIGRMAKLKSKAFMPSVVFKEWRSYISGILSDVYTQHR